MFSHLAAQDEVYMKLLDIDFVLLGVLVAFIIYHAVFMIYEKLERHEKDKKKRITGEENRQAMSRSSDFCRIFCFASKVRQDKS